MTSSPGIRTSSHSALKLSGARGPGTLRAKVYPARLLFPGALDNPRADNTNMHKASPGSLWLAPAGALLKLQIRMNEILRPNDAKEIESLRNSLAMHAGKSPAEKA